MGDRDRSPRRDRRNGGGGGGGRGKKGPADRRIFINNLPFEAKWQDVKDLFRKEIGEVAFVELFEDETGRPRGAGVLELGTAELAKKAVEKMNRFDFKGRKIVVKEDFDVERDKFGRIITDKDRERFRGGRERSPGGPVNYGNTYGLSTRFLESLGIDSHLHTRVFVANLAYDVDEKKIKEVFRLAGKVVGLELTRDREGKSRGFAVVVYEHPVEAVQSISMFHDQQLNDRRMTVRFDKVPEEEPPRNLNRLPDGLRGIGMGLGPDGAPLWDVKNNLPNANNEGNPLGLGSLATSMNMGGAPTQSSTVAAIQGALATIMGMATNTAAMQGGMAGMGGLGMDQGMGMGLGSGRELGSMNELSLSRGVLGSLDRLSAFDRGMGGMDRLSDRSMGLDRGMGGMDRGGMSSIDRGLDIGLGSDYDGMGGMDRGMGGMDRGGAGMERGMGGMDRGMGGMDRGMGGMDRGMAGMDRGMGGMRGSGGMGQTKRSDKIMVKNLPQDISWQALKDRFGHAGDIKFAEIRERGVGVIRFGSERDAERAVSMMDGQRLDGRNIVVALL